LKAYEEAICERVKNLSSKDSSITDTVLCRNGMISRWSAWIGAWDFDSKNVNEASSLNWTLRCFRFVHN